MRKRTLELTHTFGLMDLGLENKVAVVTGASKGIGLAIAHALAAEGVGVVAGALTVDSIQALNGITPVEVDLAEPDGPAYLVGEAVTRFGQVDILVNNVGAAHTRLDGFLSVSDADFEASLQLNFFAALRATRAAVEDMATRKDGTIVNVASVNAFFEPDGAVIDYGAAKAALLNLAKYSPSQMPSGRFTTPEEVATIVTLLASPRIGNVTGANWVIDGGLTKTT